MRRRGPVFLPPQDYRQRRLRDAARLLPVAGIFLLLLPILWRGRDGAGPATGTSWLYLLGVWSALVLGAFLLSRWIADPGPGRAPGDDRGSDGGGEGAG